MQDFNVKHGPSGQETDWSVQPIDGTPAVYDLLPTFIAAYVAMRDEMSYDDAELIVNQMSIAQLKELLDGDF